MLPLSFKEFLNQKGFNFKRAYTTSEQNKLKNYLKGYGSGCWFDISLKALFGDFVYGAVEGMCEAD